MWFPWPESKTLETPIELDDSGVFQETTSIPPHFHRARLVYFSSVSRKANLNFQKYLLSTSLSVVICSTEKPTTLRVATTLRVVALNFGI